MLTPEQKTALANAKALIAEIESMDGGQGNEDKELEEAYMALNEDQQMGEQPDGEEGVDKETGHEEPDGDEMTPPVKKSKVKKNVTTMGTPDASTASDDAEDRIDDQPDQSEENLSEIAKSLDRLVKAIGSKNVKKAQASSKDANGLTKVIVDLTKVVKSMQRDQIQQRAVLTDILDGLGMAKAVEQNYQTGVQKAQGARQRPVQTTDTNEVLMQVTKALQAIAGNANKAETPTDSPASSVRKSLGENLEAILRQ